MKVVKFLFCALLLLMHANAWTVEKEKTLDVLVEGVVPSHGQVILSVYDSSENFLKTPIKNIIRRVSDSRVVSFKITDLPEGNYSVGAVYDEDSNGELNTGFFGIPKEMVGFSNNVKSRFGPPSFEETVFEFRSSMTLQLYLDHVK